MARLLQVHALSKHIGGDDDVEVVRFAGVAVVVEFTSGLGTEPGNVSGSLLLVAFAAGAENRRCDASFVLSERRVVVDLINRLGESLVEIDHRVGVGREDDDLASVATRHAMLVWTLSFSGNAL